MCAVSTACAGAARSDFALTTMICHPNGGESTGVETLRSTMDRFANIDPATSLHNNVNLTFTDPLGIFTPSGAVAGWIAADDGGVSPTIASIGPDPN